MDTVLVALLVLALVMLGATTLALSYERSQEMVAEGWMTMQDRVLEKSHTAIAIASAEGVGQTITLAVRNTGEEKLSDYSEWDVIVHYYTPSGVYYIESIPYETHAQSSTQWTIEGLYLSVAEASPEVYEPGILNPGEEAKLVATTSASLEPSKGIMTTISTPNGVTATYSF